MTEQPETEAERRQTVSRREEIVLALLLSLAALASSWCGYQSVRWSGVQAMYYNTAGAARIQSIGATITANQLMMIDINLFSEWLKATAEDHPFLADFYRHRFRDELKPAFNAWLETDPMKNPQAPRSPFLLPQYRLAEKERARDLSNESGRRFDLAQAANQQSDDYVLNSVVLSSVLFLAGIAANFDSPSVRWGMVAVAAVLLMLGLYNIVHYPIM